MNFFEGIQILIRQYQIWLPYISMLNTSLKFYWKCSFEFQRGITCNWKQASKLKDIKFLHCCYRCECQTEIMFEVTYVRSPTSCEVRGLRYASMSLRRILNSSWSLASSSWSSAPWSCWRQRIHSHSETNYMTFYSKVWLITFCNHTGYTVNLRTHRNWGQNSNLHV